MALYTGKVYSFDHNWSDPVVERIEWLTSVLRKRSGIEQRIRVRQVPRRTLEYTTLIGGADEIDMRQRYDAFVWSSQDKEVLVPIWPDKSVTTVQITPATTQILMPVAGFDYDDSGYVMLWRDYKTYEVIKIDDALRSLDRVLLDDAPVGTWPAGTVIVPAKLAMCDPTMSADVYASDLQATRIRFELKVPTTAPAHNFRSIAPTPDEYRDTEVFQTAGMNGTNTRTVERLFERLDFGTGQVRNDSIQSAPFGTVDCGIEIEDHEHLSEVLGWLELRGGRQKSFWFPTFEHDFFGATNEAEFHLSSDQFVCDDFGYGANYNLLEGRRDIAFINVDGSMSFRRITATSVVDGLEVFTLDSDLPDPYLAERVSFLRFCRLDHDDIELTWQTTDDCSIALKFRELTRTT